MLVNELSCASQNGLSILSTQGQEMFSSWLPAMEMQREYL